MRMLHGNPPPNTPPEASFDHEQDATRWLLFPSAPDKGWRGYKLAADGSAERKANYWFSLTPRGTWFGRSRDLKLMKDHRPALYAALIQHFGLDDRAHGKTPPVDTPVEAPAVEREPAVEVGLLRSLWVVTCVPDPLGWDEITITPTEGDGPSWVFLWNGSAFRDDESWLSFSTRYIKSVGPLEQMLRDLG